jgi:hypothetical protein
MGFLDRAKASMTQVHFEYLGGHPDITRQQQIRVGREGENINLYALNKDEPIAMIPISSIKNIKLEKSGSRSLGKAAGGAIIGGALLGPVGLIAGGALGGRKKNESVVILVIQYGVTELEVLLGGEYAERHYPRIVQLLK